MPDRATKQPSHQIKELKVSGHTMALEPGLYCVFNAPDGPTPAPDTGLPGVRITVSPAAQGGTVDVAGFKADGWIGPEGAALVRVAGAAADVMVTVYQAPNSAGDAPRLQVVRLSPDDAAAPPPAAQTAAPRVRPAPDGVEVVAHVYAQGDIGGKLGEWMGEPGSNRWIEGFGIAPAEGVPLTDIEYQAVLGRGWLSPWSEGGQFCGSRGMSLPILGLRVRLRGASAATHRVVLSATFIDGTRIGPVADGDACEAPSLAALEAFQIAIASNAEKASKPARAKTKAPPSSPPAAKAAAPSPAAKPRPAPPKPTAAKPTAAKPTAAKPTPAPTRRR